MVRRLTITTAALLLLATAGSAQMMGDADRGMGGMNPLVAADGTVLVARPMAASQSGAPAAGMELLAVAPGGSVVWHWSGSAGVRDIALAGNMVVVTAGLGMGQGPMSGTDNGK